MIGFTLIDATGSTSKAELVEPPALTPPTRPLRSRTAYAAAHVIPRTWANNVPGAPAELDWDATLAYRHHLWQWGLGVADAMDTAQRNMGLDPAATRELIKRSAAEARAVGGRLVVGVNTDHVPESAISLTRIIDAYKEQLHLAEDEGAGVVLMASRHLAKAATSASDYERVYAAVIDAASAPVILHWLGTAFDPELRGYFGSEDVSTASRTVLRIIGRGGGRVGGIKMSLLDADAEVTVRDALPREVSMYTGDDFNYVELIAGSQGRHSDALLGAFSVIPSLASKAIQELDNGHEHAFRAILEPTVPLSRHVFATPTFHYKTGVAFISWLNGHQITPAMVGGLHAARSVPHLSRIVALANACGALEQPELAAERWHSLLRLNGVIR